MRFRLSGLSVAASVWLLAGPALLSLADDPLDRPWEHQAFLGLSVADHGDGCIVGWVMPGPLLEGKRAQPRLDRGDLILSVDGKALNAAGLVERVQKAKPGDILVLRVLRTGSDSESAMPTPGPKKVEEEIRVKLASKGEWSGPVNLPRPPETYLTPESVLGADTAPTPFEALLMKTLEERQMRQPVEKLVKLFEDTQRQALGYHSLSRVTCAFYRPMQLPRLERLITQPLASLPGDPRQVFIEAAKNLDVRPPDLGPPVDLSRPVEALEALEALTSKANERVSQAFSRIDSRALPRHAGLLLDLLASDAVIKDFEDPRQVLAALRATMDVRYDDLLAAGGSLAGLLQRSAKPPKELKPMPLPAKLKKAVKGDVLAVKFLGGRWYVYGGPGPNEYDLSCLHVVVDAGGDDLYRYRGPERPQVQVVIDLGGRDRYTCDGPVGPAGAFLGVNLLLDYEGDDVYTGGLFSCGFGLLGLGVLVDWDGSDQYSGTRLSQGVGYYGLGAVLDLGGGSDTYTAHLMSQGLGGSKGFGLLLDSWGSDFYRVYGPTPSAYGTPAVYLGMSQGVGYGLRGYDTGGIGVLCDLGGEDRYEAGEFSQGGGYFWGLGILHDAGGNDLYFGDRYGQGYGCHQACGVLVDDQGDDTYWAQCAACQGGAWDIGMGLLLDRRGNDAYRADGLSQGGAAMQAIAWLIDLEGTDRYTAAGGATHGQSSGNAYHYRETGCFSFSLFLDAGGTFDIYSTGRPNGQTLSTGSFNEASPQDSGLHGLFIDTPDRVELGP
ncbi:MAG: hypothetical protein HYU36_00220 [Planctomycetes bacterium]|nr:hypothetical protein [Planctomycetota bacterium]